MRLHRFFIDTPLADAKLLSIDSPELIHQWFHVFRYKAGDRVLMLDGTGLIAEASLVSITKKSAELEIISIESKPFSPKREVHLYFSLIRKERFELILEKGTELGVTMFHPLLSERSENKAFNAERALKIIREAGEQCGRTTLPALAPLASLKDAFPEKNLTVYALHTAGETPLLDGFVNTPVGIVIGPEGGWSEGDLATLEQAGVKLYRLAGETLRAETAAIAVTALALLGK